MAVRKILKWPSAKLRLKSTDVTDFDEARLIAVDCADTMKANLGVGTAAPQVGFNKKILVVDSKTLPSLLPSSVIDGCCVLVNSKIEVLSDETFEWEEACLSVDEVQARIKRYSRIKINYQDLNQDSHSFELEGPESGVIQHESDHLVGKLFIDHLSFYERKRLLKRIKRKNIEKTEELKAKNRKKLAELKRISSRKKRKKSKKTFGKNKRKK